MQDSAFCAEKPSKFSIHTTWIETEFSSSIDPWDGSIEEGFDAEDLYRTVVVEVEGRRLKVGVPAGIFAAGQNATLNRAPKRAVFEDVSANSSQGRILSPMQATVVKVAVKPGDKVVKGELLCVLEAMKMEQPITAAFDGKVRVVDVREGDSVAGGQLLIEVK